jgi:NAD(P)-dependent dehydrogenase (short-subunit alcohol dehydrogenase family)
LACWESRPGSFGGVNNSAAAVTGASTGIGREIARQLAVYVGSRDAEREERVVAEIGSNARLPVLDVTDATSVVAAAG